ncbi:hypothetical protein [Parachitinimonas caeni]|uniref:Uncharacterized protein n=1 Tax=Parachitinimonas caeni TaxID=3031301 RepID=A0ABT7DWD4_9NEIS|nr:hypothetical protein [Parachitinimonas caeni]MDK2124134.1 hypothetical protein [Parachitinimonas caeni]
MRTMEDAKGIVLFLDWVRGEDAYAGMLEGTPYLARKFRLLRGRTAMNSPGVYVHGLDELEAEIATLSRDTPIWAPRESWCARLLEAPDWHLRLQNYLLIQWYQEGGDPMATLSSIVATLDFRALCQQEAVEPED